MACEPDHCLQFLIGFNIIFLGTSVVDRRRLRLVTVLLTAGVPFLVN